MSPLRAQALAGGELGDLGPLEDVIVCRRCGKPVEPLRRCYVIPTCYACLPPPPELPVLVIAPAARTRKPARQGEGALSDAIRDALAHEPGLLLFRNSQAVMRKGSRVYRGGLGNGTADLVGVLTVRVRLVEEPLAGEPVRWCGLFVALEVKSPGEIPTAERIARARAHRGPSASPEDKRICEQEDFAASVRQRGGFACYVDGVTAARDAIARARTGRLS